jgi:glycosyltransferase involved in cell wall biosynthesis
MNHSNPRVSIGVPVYNGENFLKEALDSLLAQTYEDFEIIISDNASTDTTEAICREYAAKDRRIRYYRSEENLGPAWNHNRVFELATGEYFKWACHDDMCAPDFLQKCVEVLDRDESVVVCYSKTKIIDDTGKVIEEYDTGRTADSPNVVERFRDLRAEHRCYQIYGLMRSRALKQTDLIGYYAHGDGVLLVQLGFLGRFYKIPDYLFFSRNHARQSTKIAQSNYNSYTAWFDPKKAGQFVMPWWRVFREYCLSIGNAPLTWRERLGCALYMVSWLKRKHRLLLGEAIAAISFIPIALLRTLNQEIGKKWLNKEFSLDELK